MEAAWVDRQRALAGTSRATLSAMSYVMVPVPEQLAEEVKRFALKLAVVAAFSKWELPALRQLLELSGAQARSVIVTMARGNLEGVAMSAEDVGAALGMSSDQVVETATKVNETCRANRWPDLVLMKSEPEDDGDGGQHVVRRFLLNANVARMVSAERSEQ